MIALLIYDIKLFIDSFIDLLEMMHWNDWMLIRYYYFL